MGLTSVVTRAQRLSRLFRETREQTGSFISALAFVGRLVARKLPNVVGQMRSVMRHKAEARRIVDIKARSDGKKPFIAIKVTGGFGDLLVIARFMRDLSAFAGQFDFDVYTTDPQRAKWVFGAVDGLRSCHDAMLFAFTCKEYDMAARVNQFVTVEHSAARWTSLRAQTKLRHAIKSAIKFQPTIQAFIDNHPYMDGYLAQKAVYSNCTRANFLHHIMEIPYGGDRLNLAVTSGQCEHYGLQPRRYITIHNGFDPEFIISSGSATKCYPYFDDVIGLLKHEWPDLQFVQIGVSTSQPLLEVDLNLVNRTSMNEAASLIKDAFLHIDNEGGLVHLARCLGVVSCVVFGPTPSNYFGYDDNINIDPSFCGGCWWTNETWMGRCPRNFDTAQCMTQQAPAAVAKAIDRWLTENGESLPAAPKVALADRSITGG
jgi:hypothetical protein